MPPDRPDPAQGVFETFLVSDGHVLGRDAHLARLTGSVAALYRRSLPDGMITAASLRCAVLTDGDHRLRLDVIPRDGALDWDVTSAPVDPDRPRRYACLPAVVPGGLGPHKWRDRRLLARLGQGGQVPLLVDRDGSILEAGWANVWLLDGDRLLTPPADGRLLPGVTRSVLLELAPALGLTAVQQPIPLAAALAAPICLLTSSVALAALATLPGGAPPPPEAPAIADRIRDALRSALATFDAEPG